MTKSFLIVDDSSVIRTTLEKMLERFGPEGQRIYTAETSEEALELFREHQPDVVLLDIMLSDESGAQTAEVIFSEDPECRVVVITGLTEDDERVREMISMGAFDVLQKPIRSSDVKELIQLLAQEEDGAGRND